MDNFFVTCFVAKELATKAIHYKTAIYLSVRRPTSPQKLGTLLKQS